MTDDTDRADGSDNTAGPVADATDKVSEHARRFNEAIRTGIFEPFVESFAVDAVMSFEALPYGPFVGREAILAAYLMQPPTESMTVTWVEGDTEQATAMVAWSDGTTGTMALRWRSDEVEALSITFDA